jgi:hypothetical protein
MKVATTRAALRGQCGSPLGEVEEATEGVSDPGPRAPSTGLGALPEDGASGPD